MKTLILIMFIYFIMQLLKKSAQGQQQSGRDLPEYRPSGDDVSLPGPWNRRTETGAELPLPGSWDSPGGQHGDVPLPGPWERKPPREQPVETQTESRWEPDFEPEPANEPEPVREKRRKSQPASGSRDGTFEPARNPEPRRGMDQDVRIPGRSTFPGPLDECDVANSQDRRSAAIQEPVRRRRRRRSRATNPLTAVLSCNTTLVGSMVLGQVLGNRGGRAAERKTHR